MSTSDDAGGATEQSSRDWLSSKGINVFLAVIVGVAVIGFFVGTEGDHLEAQLAGFGEEDRSDRAPREVAPARSYSELMRQPYLGNEHWDKSLGVVSGNRPDLHDEVVRTEEMTRAALVDRMEHRAYEGAPPTVPHPIRERGGAECMACHGEGLRIVSRLAPPMSHDYFRNCTQCHVPENASIPAADDRYEELPLANAFVGLERWGPGDRAQPGAPPTSPHPVNMREDCTSCHGTMARPGIRTTHPWKTQCVQCHAPSATLDQRPMMPGLEPVGGP